MLPPHGKAPVTLSDLLPALQTGIGARPKPAGESSEDMRSVPVELQLIARDGFILTLPATEWALFPWTRPGKDADGKPVEVPQRSRLVLCAVLPPGFTLTADPPPAPVREPATVAAEVPWTSADSGIPIPELASVDPAVFDSDTSKPAGHYDKSDKMKGAAGNKGDAS